MIKRLVVEGLYDHFDFDLRFHEDVNLLTGRNGSGKTTLMKIMWGMLSGRIGNADAYPSFRNVFMEVEGGRLFQGEKESFEKFGVVDPGKWELPYQLLVEGDNKFLGGSGNSKRVALDIPRLGDWLPSIGRTLFFPTFRRNEGGYEFLQVPQPPVQSPLSDGHLENMIRAASNGPRDFHVFVNYSSTIDINYILATLQANIATQTQKLEKEQGDFVLTQTARVDGDERAIIQAIRAKQEETNAKVAELMKPLTNLSEMIKVLFREKGIQVAGNITLGLNDYMVNAEQLSSGEKQMLSFLAYCSICKNTIVFIDEPELSLSPDWQRLLVPMLLSIPNGNQYFLATHSPFIYAKYPDKDVSLDHDKGGE